MAEKLNLTNNERLDELSKEAKAGLERIENNLEKRNSPERRNKRHEVESAKFEAIEQAKSKEAEKSPDHTVAEKEKPPVIRSKRTQKESFSRIMDETRHKMNPASRTFSKVIHNPVVEKTSETVGKTIARPNAILAGSVSACLIVLATYTIAKNYGYPLSGAETIIAFAGGWILGIIYDFFRQMITGGR